MNKIEKTTNDILSTRSQLYWSALLKIPGQIVSFAISILVARLLVPSDFGIMGIVMMLIGYANLFTNFGFAEAIIQKRITDSRTLNSIFVFNLTFSCILAILFFVFSGYIADFFKSIDCKNVIRVMSLVFIISSFSVVPSAVLRRDMNFRTLSLIDLCGSLLVSFVTLGMALIELGYWALAFGQLIPNILITLYLCFAVRWIPVLRYSHTSMNAVLNFGMWNFIKTQLGFIAQHTDRFITGKWLGTANLGLYDKALVISETPYNALAMNISGVMFSSFSKNQDDKHKLQQSFKKSLTLISFINFPIYTGMIVVAPYFVYSLLGVKWAPMVISMQILLFSCFFKSFTGITASLNVGIGQYKEYTIRFLVAIIFFVISCFSLLHFSIAGIAISYFIFHIIQVILEMNMSLRNTNLSWLDVWKSVSSSVFASATMFFVTQVIAHRMLTEHSFSNMILIVLIGMCAYCLFILLDNSSLTREFKNNVIHDIKIWLTSVKGKK